MFFSGGGAGSSTDGFDGVGGVGSGGDGGNADEDGISNTGGGGGQRFVGGSGILVILMWAR